ncbi:SRPBCC domain-containing protein [Ruania albidiflava]|uniref:SRPBCC domain-containing protein n=1 Tax=Ruania albidiflava TaxID=366586 RepID=UPI0023F064FB|nr:SRPBCC domain-containing protein [Ruania albidiflava]
MTNPPASIDDEAFTVEREIRIDAPQATVWAALTTPEHIAGWFGQQALFPDGVHTGARGTFAWPEHGPFPVQIVTFSPTEEFAFTWGTPGEPIREDNATTATFTLREDGGQTVLRVVESGFGTLGDAAGRRAAMEDNAFGWTAELDELVAYTLSLTRAGGPAAADLEAGTILRTVRIDAPRSAVWTALTTPEHLATWWGHPSDFPDGWKPGSLGRFYYEGGQFAVRIDQLEPPAVFAFSWGLAQEETTTSVRFILADDGGATLVTVVESGFARRAETARRTAIEENVGGWNQVLDALAAFVTHGVTAASAASSTSTTATGEAAQ